MKRALPLLAAGLLVLACLPVPDSEEGPAQGSGQDRSALEKLVAVAVNPAKLLESEDKNAQKKTVADLRNTGTAMFSWLTDEVGAGAAGQSQMQTVDLAEYPVISRADLAALLVPQYIAAIPEKDGWGHPYEYHLDVKNPLAQKVMSIRSPGRDGLASDGPYTVAPFQPEDFDQDIVWSDGFFVRWPQAPPQP
jgi:hypothetical protein